MHCDLYLNYMHTYTICCLAQWPRGLCIELGPMYWTTRSPTMNPYFWPGSMRQFLQFQHFYHSHCIFHRKKEFYGKHDKSSERQAVDTVAAYPSFQT